MDRLFAVVRTRGPNWKTSRPLEKQPAWRPHADFMNGLAAECFVLLGGPLVGTADVLLVVRAASAAAVRRRLARDPWARHRLLAVRSVRSWSLRLGTLAARPGRDRKG